MDMMSSIASMSSEMTAARFAMDYATSITKKSMDLTETLAEGFFNDMLPQTLPTAPSEAMFIDTYA